MKQRVGTIALIVFIAAFSLSFIRWVACNLEREVVIEEPTAGLGDEATSDTLAPLKLQRSIEATRAADGAAAADGGAIVSDPLVVPVSEVELEKAREELEVLDRTFAYNPFAGFNLSVKEYALLARVHDEWQTARGRLLVAEKNGSLTPEQVSDGLDKAGAKAYANYQAILGADKVEMMVTDMREWGRIEVVPKLSELREAARKE